MGRYIVRLSHFVFNMSLLCRFNCVPSCFKCISIFRGSGNFFMVPLPLSHVVDIDANGEDEVWFALVSASFQRRHSVTNTSLGLSSSHPPPLKMAVVPATLLLESASKRSNESHYVIFVFCHSIIFQFEI